MRIRLLNYASQCCRQQLNYNKTKSDALADGVFRHLN